MRGGGAAVRARAGVHLTVARQFPKAEIAVVEHHQAHAASAFFASPFEEATVLTLDHDGDFRCGGALAGRGNQIQAEREWYYPDSLGGLYGAVTQLLGFAPEPRNIRSSGSRHRATTLRAAVRGDLGGTASPPEPSFFDRPSEGGFSRKFLASVGIEDGAEIPRSNAGADCAGLQTRRSNGRAGLAGEGENLCLAGGLFLNVMLVELARPLEECLRAAGCRERRDGSGRGVSRLAPGLRPQARLTGRSVSRPGLRRGRDQAGAGELQAAFPVSASTDEMLRRAVACWGNKILAWMQGRMEFGPRALGNRSILASPLDPYSTENLNVFIKHREPFRKFAASVPAEVAGEYFETGPNARYLATVGRVRPKHRKTFEAAILGRGCHPRTRFGGKDNPLYHRLLPQPGRRRAAGALQHQLQSVRRSAGLDAARCGAQLLLVGHRRDVRGEFLGRKVSTDGRLEKLAWLCALGNNPKVFVGLRRLFRTKVQSHGDSC